MNYLLRGFFFIDPHGPLVSLSVTNCTKKLDLNNFFM